VQNLVLVPLQLVPVLFVLPYRIIVLPVQVLFTIRVWPLLLRLTAVYVGVGLPLWWTICWRVGVNGLLASSNKRDEYIVLSLFPFSEQLVSK
jgi:hypothetical protein